MLTIGKFEISLKVLAFWTILACAILVIVLNVAYYFAYNTNPLNKQTVLAIVLLGFAWWLRQA